LVLSKGAIVVLAKALEKKFISVKHAVNLLLKRYPAAAPEHKDEIMVDEDFCDCTLWRSF